MGSPEPVEAQSIRNWLHLFRIGMIIYAGLLALIGVLEALAALAAYAACTSIAGNYCLGLGYVLVGPIAIVVFGLIAFILYMQTKEIEMLVNQRRFEAAKEKTTLWMIIGFVLAGVVPGVLLLIVYLKLDPLINWQRTGQMPSQAWPPPPPANPPAPGAAPVAAPPPAAGVAPPPPPSFPVMAPNCPTCGRPTTFVPEYGRYYCTNCRQYV